MAFVLSLVGYGWAVLGGLNIVMLASRQQLEAVGLFVNVAFLVLPGLAVGALGQMLHRRKRRG